MTSVGDKHFAWDNGARTFAELQAIYHRLRSERPEAQIRGCTRAHFRKTVPAGKTTPNAANNNRWMWTERAGNNSTAYPLIAGSCDEQV